MLRPHIIGDDEARARLAREVASLRRVTSPRIAEVIDADPWGETPYVATRYVPGLSLHEHVRQEGPITGADLTHFAAGLAEAVIAVHQVGVLHRDIKPSNVLLEGRSPVLIDFGLARLAEDPRLTHTGWLLGTPGYLAPEILYGDDATTASDVHSWAATVVFAATGRPPFGTGPAMAIMDRVRRGEHDLSGGAGRRCCRSCTPASRRTRATGPTDRDRAARSLRGAVPRRPHAAGRAGPAPPAPSAATTARTARHAAARHRPTRPSRRPCCHRPVRRTCSRPRPGPRLVPPDGWRPPPSGLPTAAARRPAARALRAPRRSASRRRPTSRCLPRALLALAVRTVSWTTESARERQHLRGRRRWYDGPLTVASSPWYLVVADRRDPRAAALVGAWSRSWSASPTCCSAARSCPGCC